jgi:hypothetical protein
MKLILIHGRSQEEFEEKALKQTWIDTLHEGLAKNNLTLPADVTIEFPYYGKLLKKLTDNPALIATLPPSTRSGKQVSELTFSYEFLAELLKNTGEAAPTDRGILNNELIQELFQKLDRKKKLGELAIKLFTKDVFYYLTKPEFQDAINAEIFPKFSDEPCVVVGHSLGSIVSYVILQQNPHLKVTKLITVGSPLGLASIRKHLPQPLTIPECVQHGWFNAYDDGDFVALNPLDNINFPLVKGDIENKNDVVNPTDNQHGIIGYLNDAAVAKQIYDAMFLP